MLLKEQNLIVHRLSDRVKLLLYDLRAERQREADRLIRNLIKMETAVGPFTLNNHYYITNKEASLADLKRRKYGIPSDSALSNQSGSSTARYAADAIAHLAKMGITGIKPEQLYNLLPSREDDAALETMASAAAYFKVCCCCCCFRRCLPFLCIAFN